MTLYDLKGRVNEKNFIYCSKSTYNPVQKVITARKRNSAGKHVNYDQFDYCIMMAFGLTEETYSSKTISLLDGQIAIKTVLGLFNQSPNFYFSHSELDFCSKLVVRCVQRSPYASKKKNF